MEKIGDVGGVYKVAILYGDVGGVYKVTILYEQSGVLLKSVIFKNDAFSSLLVITYFRHSYHYN